MKNWLALTFVLFVIVVVFVGFLWTFRWILIGIAAVLLVVMGYLYLKPRRR